MALNLLDSLNSPSTSTEKNIFSLKSRPDGEVDAGDFGGVLSELMPALSLKRLGLAPGEQPFKDSQEATAGQEVATALPEKADASRASDTDTLSAPTLMAAMPTVPQALTALVLSPSMTVITPNKGEPDASSLRAFAQSQGLDADVAAWLMAAGQRPSQGAPMTDTALNQLQGLGADVSAKLFAAGQRPSQQAPVADAALNQSQGLDANVTANLLAAEQRSSQAAALVDIDLNQSHGLGADESAKLLAAGQRPSQGASFKDTAFVHLGGLGANAASKIMPAGQITTSGASHQDATVLSQAAALATSQPVGATPAIEQGIPTTPHEIASRVPLSAMTAVLPASRWAQRIQTPEKVSPSGLTTAVPGSDKAATHTGVLDLTMLFNDTTAASKSVTTPPPDLSFTPAAWVMASATNSQDTNATTMVKVANDDLDSDTALKSPDSLQSAVPQGTGSSPKTGESGPSAAVKGFESALSATQRNELHQAQADKMGQAIAQRMLSELEKGHWHLKMMLRPANLGHIEVEMRLRNGELDAHFTASQSATRDLLQDGLPKLKDTLTQMGMDVASMDIGSGSSRKNGGDPTPQRAQTLTTTAKTEPAEEPANVHKLPAKPSGQDGLDVLV